MHSANQASESGECRNHRGPVAVYPWAVACVIGRSARVGHLFKLVPVALIVVALAGGAPLGAQATSPRDTDLDRFMAAVLARRDDNWKKLQQYILEERERVQVLGPGGARLFGLVHDYRWFVKDGFFIRSPLVANGVTIGEDERRRKEAEWLRREQRRETRRVERERKRAEEAGETPPPEPAPAADGFADVLRQQSEPSFVRAAYFLRFKFESGRYALVGKETLNGREALRIEYYPERLFDDDDEKTRAERRAEQVAGHDRDRDDDPDDARIQAQLNKVSLITLWVLRNERQIVRYVFDNVDFGFLPGRSVARVEDLRASMTMAEAFPGIWLPQQIEARMAMAFAPGTVEARYDITYSGYKEAGVAVRVR